MTFDASRLTPARRATRWEITTCGHCPHPHVVLIDENDAAIADFLLGPGHEDLLAKGAKEIRDHIAFELQEKKRKWLREDKVVVSMKPKRNHRD